MIPENYIDSPPDSEGSKRSRGASKSVSFANSIQDSAHTSQQPARVTPLSYQAARVSDMDTVRANIELKLDEMTKELATALENMSKELREAKLNAIGSLAKSIEQLRDEINLLHEKKKLILPGTNESAATVRENGGAFSVKYLSIIESLEIEGMEKKVPTLRKCSPLQVRYPIFVFPESVVSLFLRESS